MYDDVLLKALLNVFNRPNGIPAQTKNTYAYTGDTLFRPRGDNCQNALIVDVITRKLYKRMFYRNYTYQLLDAITVFVRPWNLFPLRDTPECIFFLSCPFFPLVFSFVFFRFFF